MEVLKKYDGTLLTKRVLKDLQKEIPEYTFDYNNPYFNRVELHIYQKDSTQRIMYFTLFYKSISEVVLFNWESCYNSLAGCYGKFAKERVERYNNQEKMNAFLKKTKELEEMAIKFKEMQKEYESTHLWFSLGD